MLHRARTQAASPAFKNPSRSSGRVPLSLRFISGLPQTTDLLSQYQALVAAGTLKHDEDQVRIIIELRKLQRRLVDYTPASRVPGYLRPSLTLEDVKKPWWTPLAHDEQNAAEVQRALVKTRSVADELANLDTPKGMLLTGPPGSGKSFLVDMWSASLPTPYKVRLHYNEFVLQLYRGIWEETQRRMAQAASAPRPTHSISWTHTVRRRWHTLTASGGMPYTSTTSDPSISFELARRLVLRHWLLVFDEVQLLDVSSAGVLADVLSWFWRLGGVVVGTSNAVPNDLYRQGVARERLAPFLEALEARCPVVEMQGAQDWRVARAELDMDNVTWFTFKQKEDFEDAIKAVTQEEPTMVDLNVFGRCLRVPWAAGGVARFGFAELCNQSLGPADYLTLASSFHTIALTDIPVLTLATKNQARRFISLVDALYERRCRLVCHAAASPEGTFFPHEEERSDVNELMAEAMSEAETIYRPNISSYVGEKDERRATRDEDVRKAVALDNLAIFSGHDERFAYKRALSRLKEMTSTGYARDTTWTPLPSDARKWESSDALFAPSAARPPPPDIEDAGPDYAAEAAFEGGRAPSRPEAPILREHHVWGVREDWGRKAGAWGKGAKVYHDDQGSRKGS